MIILHIHGALSQQLGQYAFGRECAARLRTRLKLDPGAVGQPLLLDYFTFECELASADEIAAARRAGTLGEDTLLCDGSIWQRLRDGLYLDGVWHDFGYSANAMPALIAGLGLRRVPGDEVRRTLQAIRKCDAASLDLREDARTQPLSYYRDAVADLRARAPDAHLFVLCDDADALPRLIALDGAHTPVAPAQPLNEAEALLLMTACKHHIIGYGGTAYWAARLDPKGAGAVIAPQQAFDVHDAALAARHGAIRQPLWPAGWCVLPIRSGRAPMCYADIEAGRSPARRMRVAVWSFYEEVSTAGFLFHQAAAIGHDLLKPWADLHAYGQAHGMDFVTFDQVAGTHELDAVIFLDRPQSGHPALAQLMAADIPKYLLLYECPVIKQDNWEAEYHQRFTRVFTWNDTLVDGQRYVKINFAIDPVSPYDFAVLKSAFEQRKLVTLIAGAKESSHPHELYSDRLRSIRWFELSASADFDLYGMGWDGALFPSYRGKVDDKLATLSRYRFAICYENAKLYPGYITEKILDCFRAGTVPVYGGAPNIGQWVPADCFIDIGRFGTYDALYQHLKTMDAATHGRYLDNIARFLAQQAYPFSTECFIRTVTQFVAWDVQLRRGEVPLVARAAPGGPQLGQHLVQDKATLALRVEVVAAPPAPPSTSTSTSTSAAAPAPTLLGRIAATERPDLVVYIGYGHELPVYRRARALWQFYMSHFPRIKTIFVRETDQLARGEVTSDGYDMLIGLGPDSPSGAPGLAATGVWSQAENAKLIYRQMAVYDFLLRTQRTPFFLYQTTVTSVIDFRALAGLLDRLPKTGCYAGTTGRLTAPQALDGLVFISGANSLFSSDLLALMRHRYDPGHIHASLPNDVWQALTLQDVPRLALPSFNFHRARAPREDGAAIGALARRMLADGHFHFRVKTDSEDKGVGTREDVDPWIMLRIMEEVLSREGAPEATAALVEKFARFIDGGAGAPLAAFGKTDFYGGQRDFPLADTEV